MKRRFFLQRLIGLPVFAKCLPLRLQAQPAELTLVSTPVVGTTRKLVARRLTAVWTCEMEDNLQAFHNIKAEKVLEEAVNNFVAGVVKPEQQRVQVESL